MKINLEAIHKEAHKDGYQPGRYRQLYLAAAPTTRMPVPARAVHTTNEYDLRLLSLPSALDKLIRNFQDMQRPLSCITLHPDTLELLRQAGFIRNNRYRGAVQLCQDKEMDKVSIKVDNYSFAL